jgi:hypothetical protein
MSRQLEFAARNLVQDPRVRHGGRAPGYWPPAGWFGFEADWDQHFSVPLEFAGSARPPAVPLCGVDETSRLRCHGDFSNSADRYCGRCPSTSINISSSATSSIPAFSS